MTESEPPTEILSPDAVDGVGDGAATASGESEEGASDETAPAPSAAVSEPAKVMRIGSMVKQLLEEVRNTTLDEASRERLAEVYERSVTELGTALSPELQVELHGLALPFDDDEVPSESELRIAKAQLVGWLEGLFHGIQASLMAQQFAAQQQLQQMRQLPAQAGDPAEMARRATPPQTGTYL